MYKNSFTILEVLVSLIILSLVVVSTIKLYENNNTNSAIYYQLQNQENEFITTHKVTNSENIIYH
ncbi:MAG: prepilin-type N-terminal cleavage/methylation domain-containing protein [Campylobacterota bacterium]|nr:prepilin-type N-terminal cleavage/methylation domain-containing protein [Campylobacterota bacterium]